MIYETIEMRLARLLSEFTGEPKAGLSMDELWIDSSGLDSLGVFRFILFVEEKFGIEFAEEEIDLQTVGHTSSLVSLISGHLEKPGSRGGTNA